MFIFVSEYFRNPFPLRFGFFRGLMLPFGNKLKIIVKYIAISIDF